MMFTRNLVKKANSIRKQNWSAPSIMATFIFVCMIIIFSFESLGILNKEKNLDYRITSPEKFIKVISVEKTVTIKAKRASNNNGKGELKNTDGSSPKNDDHDDETHNSSFKFKEMKEQMKEARVEEMMNILVSGATNQYEYLNSQGVFTGNEISEITFFDV